MQEINDHSKNYVRGNMSNIENCTAKLFWVHKSSK